MTAKSKERPYAPSWVDRLNDWVEKLPIRVWIFYLVLGIALILLQFFSLWLAGALNATEILPVVIFNGLAIPFLLALISRFDSQAVTAINSIRSSLELTVPECDDYQYRLANMPARSALIAGLTLLVIVIVMERLSAVPSTYALLEQLPGFAVVYHIVDKSSAFMYGVFIYHTVRQLRLVSTITSSHLRINLFDVGPTQAFSKLTASTALGIVIGLYAWLLLNPELLENPISVGFTAAFTILAAAVFVWPLLGIHRSLETEKSRMLHQIDLLLETVFARFNQRVHDDDYAGAEGLNGTIASLQIQHQKISDIPTWPWRAETARIVLTAIALPLILMVLQHFVLQVLEG
jgi:hypothetical protein